MDNHSSIHVSDRNQRRRSPSLDSIGKELDDLSDPVPQPFVQKSTTEEVIFMVLLIEYNWQLVWYIFEEETMELIRRMMEQEMCSICKKNQGYEICGKHRVCDGCGKKHLIQGIKQSFWWKSQVFTNKIMQ